MLLKEIFDLSLEEISDALVTSVGAVKAALHRGRERLREAAQDEASPRYPVSRAVIERFVSAYNQRDLPTLLALMLDSGSIEMLGAEHFVGRKQFSRKPGWFHYNLFGFDGKPSTATWEVAQLGGEPVVLVLNPRGHERRVTSVMRIETQDEQVARVLVYAMCPDTVREVATALD